MLDGFLKPKFYNKCKSNLKLMKVRLEAIKKKRNAVQKYLKNDISDLLRSGLDINAYGRAEGLLVEQNMSYCYELIENFCGCIYSHLSVMQKQRDCPEECKEGVPSLIYAAARFSDLPELRDLRTMFTERYGNSLESCINKEFVERLRSKPPTKEKKLQLLQDIAQESSIDWDSKALETKLYTSTPKQEHPKCGSLSNTDDDKWQKSKDDAVPEKNNQGSAYRLSNERDYITKRNDRDLNFHGRKDVTDNRRGMPASSEDEMTTDLSQDSRKNSSSSVGSVSEDDVDNKKPFHYKHIPPPPYLKTKSDKNESSSAEPTKFKGHVDKEAAQHIDDPVVEDKPKPRSVRSRNLKPPPGRSNVGSSESDGDTRVDLRGTKQEDARRSSRTMHSDDRAPRNEEERIVDDLLIHYSKKKSPYESGKTKTDLKPPPSQRDCDHGKSRRNRIKSDLEELPARAASLPPEPTTSTTATKRHVRAASLQPEMLSMAGHVHPNLPDCDELAARLAALRGR